MSVKKNTYNLLFRCYLVLKKIPTFTTLRNLWWQIFFAMNVKPKIDLQVTTFTTNIRNRNSGQGCLLSHTLLLLQIIKIEQKSIYRFTALSSRHFVGNDCQSFFFNKIKVDSGSFLKYSGKKDFYTINIR